MQSESETKVDYFDFEILCYHDILRLYVSMRDASPVQLLHCSEDLQEDVPYERIILLSSLIETLQHCNKMNSNQFMPDELPGSSQDSLEN